MNAAANFETENDLIKRRKVTSNPWQDVTFLSVLVMQLCWLVPWYRIITVSPENINPSDLKDYFLFAGLLLVPYVVALVMNRMNVNKSSQRTVLYVLLALMIAVSLFSPLFIRERVNYMDIYSQSPGDVASYQYYVPNEIIIILVVFYLWRMGTNIVNHGLGTRGVIGNFIAGLVLFFFYILLNMATGTNLIPGVEIFIFLFFGLLGLSTTRIAMLRRLVGGTVSPFSMRWLGSIVGAVFAIFSGTFLLSAAIGGDVARWLFSVITGAALGLITLVLSPLFYVTQYIIEFINARVVYTDNPEAVMQESPGLGGSGDLLNSEIAQTGPIQIFSFIYLGLFLIAIVAGFFVLFRAYQDRKRAKEGNWDTDVLYTRRGNLFNALQALFDSDISMADRWQVFRERLADRIQAKERIRYIFACLLDMADDMDIPRPTSDTPLEFTEDMVRLFPEQTDELMAITQAYYRVRYGQVPETEGEVKVVEEAWLVVKDAGKRYLEKLNPRG